MPSRKNSRRNTSKAVLNEKEGNSQQTESLTPSGAEKVRLQTFTSVPTRESLSPTPTSTNLPSQGESHNVSSFPKSHPRNDDSLSPSGAGHKPQDVASSRRNRHRDHAQCAAQTSSSCNKKFPQQQNNQRAAQSGNVSKSTFKWFAWPAFLTFNQKGDEASNGWLRSIISLMFTLEDFNDDESIQVEEVTPGEVSTFRAVNGFFPSFAKKPAFYILDFFTRRRVMFVFLTIALLLGCFGLHDDVSSLTASFIIADEDRPGTRFLENHTIRHKYPVLIVPGFISTALEVWKDRIECDRSQRGYMSDFRERVFGPRMLFLLITDPVCYFKIISLDKDTGFDPPKIKIRPDMGFSATDFFMPGYWVWAKILINLADIGYDPQSIGVFAYDWRLSPQKMHQRDGAFYNLRAQIELLFKINKERVVLTSHSYGGIVLTEFLRWIEERDVGWIDKHVVYWINLGGPLIGVAKAVSATLTGEEKDTLLLSGPARHLLESHMARDLRTEVMRTWSCLIAMYPRGCNGLWPDLLILPNGTRLSAKETMAFTADRLRESGHKSQEQNARGLLENFGSLPSLPSAPRTTVVCLYGVGKDTESGYVLSEDHGVNVTFQHMEQATNGVVFGDGDGTVPLISLGYMCRAPNGLKKNVGRVITREHRHSSGNLLDLRGGSSSGDHVDILGNYEVIETILNIVTGNAEDGYLVDRIYSDIDSRINRAADCNTYQKSSI